MNIFEDLFSLHPRPDDTTSSSTVIFWRGIHWNTVPVDPVAIGHGTFDISFDDFMTRINKMPGGYAEGDGSFGVVGSGGTWKVAGNFFEANDRVAYVQFQGNAPDSVWHDLTQALDSDSEACLVQVSQGGFFITLQEWQRQRSANAADRSR